MRKIVSKVGKDRVNKCDEPRGCLRSSIHVYTFICLLFQKCFPSSSTPVSWGQKNAKCKLETARNTRGCRNVVAVRTWAPPVSVKTPPRQTGRKRSYITADSPYSRNCTIILRGTAIMLRNAIHEQPRDDTLFVDTRVPRTAISIQSRVREKERR